MSQVQTSSAVLTAVAMVVAVMHKAAAAEGKAMQALDRARAGTWAAVQEAALCFDAPMSDEDRKALSGELAREYMKRYSTEGSARAAASQHAKAIHGLTHAKGKPDSASLSDYLASIDGKPSKKERQADSGNAPKSGASEVKAEDIPPIDRMMHAAAAPSAAATPAERSLLEGLNPDAAGAVIRAASYAGQRPDFADALLVLVNMEQMHPGALKRAAELMLEAERADVAQKLGAKFGADKVKPARGKKAA